ncbi:MAG: hypothetical protein ABIT09_08000 [Croceibacterium sp.]
MNDPHQPTDPAKLKPKQETGEQFGSIKHPQRPENQPDGRSDTPRGSETDTRGASGRRR